MNTVSGSSTFSTSSATSHGMSGLVSGLDTEGMVESMLSGTQSKIDKANAEKQQITWKQEIYRDLISDINAFQNSFFGKTSSTNLTNADFFNAMSAVSSTGAFSVTASTNAATGNTSVSVGQLATSSKIQSGAAVSGKLEGLLDKSAFDRTVYLKKSDGSEISFDLSGVYEKLYQAIDRDSLTESQQTDKLAELLNAADGPLQGKGLTASVDDKGKLVLKKEGEELTVSARSGKLGLKMLGLAAGQKSVDGAFTGTADPDAAVSFTLDLNGIARTITLDRHNGAALGTGADSETIKKALEEKIGEAFGNGWVKVEVDGDKLILSANGRGNVISVSGDDTGLSLLGVVAGASNKISRGQMLKDLNFSTDLQGSSFAFEINGVKFSFTGEHTLNDVIKAVNGSSAGVRITYSEIEDRFTIESSSTGEGFDIRMSQTEGNLLNALFGSGKDGNLAAGSSVSSNELLTDEIKSGDMVGNQFNYGYFSFKADGKSYSIYLKKKEDGSGYSRDELYSAINEGLAAKLGYTSSNEQAVELKWNAAGDYSLVVRNGMKISFDDATAKIKDYDSMTAEEQKKALEEAAKSNFELAFGFSGKNNVLANDADLSATSLSSVGLAASITVNGETATTVQGLLDAYNRPGSGLTAAFKNGKIVLSLAEGEAPKDVTLPDELAGIFGTNPIALGKKPAGAATASWTDGQNAIVSVNGVTIERSSNTFSVNGLTLSLNATTGTMVDKLEDAGMAADGVTQQWKDSTGALYVVKDGKICDAATGREASAFAGMEIAADGTLNIGGEPVTAIVGEAGTVTTTRNTDQILEGIKSFVEKYNTMIEKFNKLIDQEATYKDYPPLTSAQKKEMSDREIELWEEKAKEGLLRRDSNVESFLSSMRTILYSKPEASDYALFDIGIETSSEWKDKGKLTLDESKLRTMIESNPQALQALFVGENGDGLASRLNDAINTTANTSSGSPGTLVALAGVEGKASSITNTLTKRLRELNSKIKDLQKKYEVEKARYWKQFNAMESALSSLNSQSNWLAQQFA